jgi:2-aminoadipate transaminase
MLDIDIDRKADKPIYAQIRDVIVLAINNKELRTGDKLPTISLLSKELDVTPSTIIRAFEDLTKGGYILSKVGKGTFVNDMDIKTSPDDCHYTASSPDAGSPEFMHAVRKLRMGASNSLASLSVLLEKPDLICFTSGIPDPDIIDPDILSRNIEKAMENGQRIYQEYSDPYGLKELRSIIAKRFTDEGTAITQENVLVTSGSQQAVSVIAQYALENKLRVICETPCYMGLPNAFGALGHWVDSLERDEYGPIPNKLERFYDNKPSILYLCTQLHNPMGTDISPERTEMIKDWAASQKAVIISDEIFHDLYFDKEQHKSMFDILGRDRTVVIGSMSKSLMCGLRTGWIIASPERINSFVSLKKAMDLGCPLLMQGIAASIYGSGDYDRNVQKAVDIYLERRDAVIEALKKHMPDGVRWTTSKGGFHMWVELPQGYSSIALFILAAERGVAITPGPQMDIDHRFVNGFKIGYGSTSLNKIREGIKILSDAVKILLKNPPVDPGQAFLGNFTQT